MILGTGSHVGKSLLTTALCRIFAQDGFSVAPFKAQNMALNSAATPDGLEIGRAQAMQAEAARVTATVDMNPVLIKPSSDTGAQVIVRGKIWRQVTAADYFSDRVNELFPVAIESYNDLAAAHDIVVMEGAGSPAEINLKSRDIVNLRMAKEANAVCLLVGDIDRGGVFASLYGTIALLDADEQAQIRGLLINKFRGDETLLTPGIKMIEDKIGKPCVGVVHHLPDVGLDEEDSVSLETRNNLLRDFRNFDASEDRRLRIGVIALPHISNFTDFDALIAEESVALAYLTSPDDVKYADVIILPGTKQTIDDLHWVKKNGLAEAVQRHAKEGKITIGICGGMQMLGISVNDPAGLEGGGSSEGLGILAIRTELSGEKITVPATGEIFSSHLFGIESAARKISGYEIHLGETIYEKECAPFAEIRRKTDPAKTIVDGAVSVDGRSFGTYLHGIFDADDYRHSFIMNARRATGLTSPQKLCFHQAEKEQRYDRLAAHVRRSIDLDLIYKWLEISP